MGFKNVPPAVSGRPLSENCQSPGGALSGVCSEVDCALRLCTALRCFWSGLNTTEGKHRTLPGFLKGLFKYLGPESDVLETS